MMYGENGEVEYGGDMITRSNHTMILKQEINTIFRKSHPLIGKNIK